MPDPEFDSPSLPPLALLNITQAQWGERMADNLARFKPAHWTVHRWAAPRALPLVIDDPEEYLPPSLPKVDLVLALGETAGVIQLIPDIVKMTGAKSVLAPIDRNESLPPGLVTQLREWLADLGVAVAFPKPFCSLTETTYNRYPIVVEYHNPVIAQFARFFGAPKFKITVDEGKHVSTVTVERDSVCGCARHVAEGLVGQPVEAAEYEAGMLHHHYPCLASMNQDPDYKDTLMHISGNAVRDAVKEEVAPYLGPTPYFRPAGRVEE